jgi:2-succinyl-5-enolpyruvyl-6-hydroxy-3-cyclohexene-1-carboxylate synthase
MGLNPMLTPNLRLVLVLYSLVPLAGFAPNVNILAEQVGPLTIRDYLARSVYQMQAAGFTVVNAEADDATQSGLVVFYGRDPLGRPLFQFQRLLITRGVCLIATATQLPPLDLMGAQLRAELAGILNSLQRA